MYGWQHPHSKSRRQSAHNFLAVVAPEFRSSYKVCARVRMQQYKSKLPRELIMIIYHMYLNYFIIHA